MSDESKSVSVWYRNGLVSQWVSSSPFVDTVECKHCAWQVPTAEFVSKFCPDCGYLMVNYHELVESEDGFSG